MKTPYDDIIHLPHHVSKRHPQMPLYNRAAQFAPFAALSGHDAAVGETARQTDEQHNLSQSERDRLDRKMSRLLQSEDNLEVEITYFLPDKRKSGGQYRTVTGTIKKVDEIEGRLLLTDGTVIPLDSVSDIRSEVFDRVEDL